MQIDLIIFDLDGTLVNSIPDLTDSLNYSAKQNGRSTYSEDFVIKHVGGGVTLLVETVFGLKRTDVEFEKYFNDFMDYYKVNSNTRSTLYEGLIDTLKKLKGIKLAILSNKRNDLTLQVIENFKIKEYFDLVMGATKQLAKKPSAEPILYILDKFGVDAANAIFVGDSEADIMCAKNAGIKSIAVTYGYRTYDQLISLKPDFITNNIDELPSIIKN